MTKTLKIKNGKDINPVLINFEISKLADKYLTVWELNELKRIVKDLLSTRNSEDNILSDENMKFDLSIACGIAVRRFSEINSDVPYGSSSFVHGYCVPCLDNIVKVNVEFDYLSKEYEALGEDTGRLSIVYDVLCFDTVYGAVRFTIDLLDIWKSTGTNIPKIYVYDYTHGIHHNDGFNRDW